MSIASPPKKQRKKRKPKVRSEINFFEGGSSIINLPHSIHKNETLVGYEWKEVDLIDVLRDIPDYDVFLEAEGFTFSIEEAKVIIYFIINECIFPEGKLTGKTFVPEQWQWAIYLNTYCWFDNDRPDIRRFNEVLVYIPRKNGKTTAFGAIPSLISIFVDPEPRSQNFCCAADIEQAALNFRHAAYMVEQNDNLLNLLTQGKVRHAQRYMEHNNGRTLKVLSSIADTKHGLSPNYVGVDELHAHRTSELIDVMATGTAARDSPLTFITTTADYERPSPCNDIYKRAKALATGQQNDPHFLPVIYEALPSDDWEDEEVWKRANPNYGISIKKRYFVKEIAKVRNSPKLLNRFLRLHLNVRTAVETTWIYPHIWAATNPSGSDVLDPDEIRASLECHPEWFTCLGTEAYASSKSIDIHLREYAAYFTWFFRKLEDLKDEPSFWGYDNASVHDIASLVGYFPNSHDFLSFNWVPAESIETRSIEDNIPYNTWHNCGIINNTPMATIDEEQIVTAMIGNKYEGILGHFTDIRMVAFDNWGANYIIGKLDEHGLPTRSYPQSYAGMNQPCKTVEAFLEQKDLFHGGNPVTSWMINNLMVTTDHNDRMRPCRKNSTDKIDTLVALMMAIGAWLYNEENVITELPGLRQPNEEAE